MWHISYQTVEKMYKQVQNTQKIAVRFHSDESLYKSASLSVSELVCVCVCLFPPKRRNFEDDSPWDLEGFRLKNIQIRQTVS